MQVASHSKPEQAILVWQLLRTASYVAFHTAPLHFMPTPKTISHNYKRILLKWQSHHEVGFGLAVAVIYAAVLICQTCHVTSWRNHILVEYQKIKDYHGFCL